MSRVKPVKREDVPELEPYIQSWEERMGFVLNDVLILAHKPKLAKAVGELSRAVFDPEVRISLELRNMVAFMASQAHGCQYCMAHVASNADRSSIPSEKVAALWQFDTSPLFDDAERAALRLAQSAASVPNTVTDADFVELRKYYDDEQLVEIMAVVAYMGFFNRWNDTFATDLEDLPRSYAEKTLKASGWAVGKHDGSR